MKIAVTTENGQVFQHFGKTKTFTLYTVENGAVQEKTLLDGGDEGHSALVGVLKNAGVELLICGGIGPGAQNALAAAGITCVAGASGDVDAAVAAYLAGTLQIGPAAAHCNHHGHGEGHTCGDHHGQEGGHTCGAHTCK